MIRIILAALVFVAVVYAGGDDHAAPSTGNTPVCQIRRGKVMRTFGNTKERLLFPCKYPLIHKTVCGDWLVTITPGNVLETEKNKRLVINTMWVAVKNIETGDFWEGRSDLKIARKYLLEIKPEPFNKKGGTLETKDVFSFGSTSEDDEVSLVERNKQFKIVFGIYNPYGRWHKASSVTFECSADNFAPPEYPAQLCGDGEKEEVSAYKKADPVLKGFTRPEAIMYSVFMDPEITQHDGDCMDTAKIMQKGCDPAQAKIAIKQCAPLISKHRFRQCVLGNIQIAMSAFRHCVEFACGNYVEEHVCEHLAEEIDGCQELEGISEHVKAVCQDDLMIAD